MHNYFNEMIAPLAQVQRIELDSLTECSQCQIEMQADDAITSDFYPDTLFCTKQCRARFDMMQYPDELPVYLSDLAREDY